MCGVPMGFILGFLLFINFINDLPDAISCEHVFLYADDTAVGVEGTNKNELEFKLNLTMAELISWMKANA